MAQSTASAFTVSHKSQSSIFEFRLKRVLCGLFVLRAIGFRPERYIFKKHVSYEPGMVICASSCTLKPSIACLAPLIPCVCSVKGKIHQWISRTCKAKRGSSSDTKHLCSAINACASLHENLSSMQEPPCYGSREIQGNSGRALHRFPSSL